MVTLRAFLLCCRVNFGPGQEHPLPLLQDLGLDVLAVLRCSKWLLIRVLPAFMWVLQEPGCPSLGFKQKCLYLGWVEWRHISSTAAATVPYRGHGVRTRFIEVVQWPGLCFLENMLLCPGITVCKAFVSKLGIMLF